MIDDIYGDLDNFDFSEELAKVRAENQSFHDDLAGLKKKIQETKEKCGVLEKENDQLKLNISTLFKTAQGEIIRKDEVINQLRTELEDLKFKRQRTKNNHSTNFKHQKSNKNQTLSSNNVSEQNYVPSLPIGNEIKREVKEEPVQTSTGDCSTSGYVRPKKEFSTQFELQDPRLERASRIDNSETNSQASHTGRIQPKHETEIKWTLRPVSPLARNASVELENSNFNEMIIPKTECDVNNTQLTSENEVETVETKMREVYNDRKRKRFSPSPTRSRRNRESPHKDKKYSAERNSNRLISRSTSRDSSRSFNTKKSLSPRHRKRSHREDDRRFDTSRFRRGRHGERDKAQFSNRRSGCDRESRSNDNRRRDEFNRMNHRSFDNRDNRKCYNKYDKRSPRSQYEFNNDRRTKTENLSELRSSEDVHSNYSSNKSETKDESGEKQTAKQRVESSVIKIDRYCSDKKVTPEPISLSTGRIYTSNDGAIKNTSSRRSKETVNDKNNPKQRDHNKNEASNNASFKKKVVSLCEYNKRHNIVHDLEPSEKFYEVPKEDSTIYFDREDILSDEFNKNDKEDGEIDSESDSTQNLIDHKSIQVERKCPSNAVRPEMKMSSKLHDLPSTDKLLKTFSNAQLENSSKGIVRESKKIKRSIMSFIDESKETDVCISSSPKDLQCQASILGTNTSSARTNSITQFTFSPLSKLLSDVANETCSTVRNIERDSKMNSSSKIEQMKPHDKENLVTDITSETSKDRKHKSSSNHRVKKSFGDTAMHDVSSDKVADVSSINSEAEIELNDFSTEAKLKSDTKTNVIESVADKTKSKYKIPKIKRNYQISKSSKDKTDESLISATSSQGSEVRNDIRAYKEEAESENLVHPETKYNSDNPFRNESETYPEMTDNDGIYQLINAAKQSDLNDIECLKNEPVEDCSLRIEEFESELSSISNIKCDTIIRDSVICSSGNEVDSEPHVIPVKEAADIVNTITDKVDKAIEKIVTPKPTPSTNNTVHFKISRRRNVAIKSHVSK